MPINRKLKTKDAIWLFAGGEMQEIAAKKIIDLGYQLILTDINPDCVCSKYANEFIHLDTFDIKGNLKFAQKLRSKYKVKAVLTVGADCHETVANVAKFLNLPGINPKISHTCRFKLETRKALQRARIPQPEFKKVTNINEARITAKEIGLPVVLKAANNSGSRGFAKIEKLSDLTPEVFRRATENGTTGYALIEKLLLPIEDETTEQSVETLWYNGKMYWLNWVDRLFRKDFLLFKDLSPDIYSDIFWGVELGHINPAIHEYEIKKRVYDLIYKAGLSIGMSNEKGGHILKADIMLTAKGPYILELTPRLSGGWDSSKTTPQRGADFIGGAISLARGEKLDLDLWVKYFQYKNPNLFSSILAWIDKGAKDCIARKFAEGSSFNREESIKNAYKNLLEKKYVSLE
jgi:biotin carboxylase